MSTKSKSAVSETPNAKISPATPNAKVSPATPRVSKFSRVAKPDADSASPLQNPRLSVDRSPRSVPSRLTTTGGRSPKLATPPEKKATPTSTRISKPSDLQAEINQAHEDLKKTKEKLCAAEKEKEKALDELKEAHKLAEEANEKLREALVAQKRAEEDSEIEKFRAVEMEQAGIEAVQKKDDEWQKELESVRNQHAVDVAALLSATQEIQKAKQDLAMTSDAKDQALRHAEDVTKIAEAHAEKIETLSAELAHLKSVLDSIDEAEASENSKLVSELELEIVLLRQELERAKSLEDKLAEKEVSIEQMNVDLEAAKMAESYARNLMDELHEQVEELGFQAEQAKRLERSASESLESIMKQLEMSNDSLHDAESEIASLKEKVGLLEISIKRQRKDFEETERSLEQAKDEASEMAKRVESLKAELETVKEEKTQSLNNERLAAASVIDLLEEKNKLINELEISRDEEEKIKQALENLASALHEVSSEARDAKEKLLSVQAERENYENQIEDLKHVLQATNEKYESMLDDTKLEINVLMSSIEQSKHDHESSKTEWEQKELHLMNAVKLSEEKNLSTEKEINRLVNLLKNTEDEVSSTRDEGDSWKNSFKEAESEVIYLKEVLGEAKTESIKLKEGLMNRENELQNILQENEELRKREEASRKEVEELTKLLEEKKEASLAKKHLEEEEDNDDENNKMDIEKDYDMLPKVVEFSEQNGTTGDMTKTNDDEKILVENSNGKIKENENEKDNSDSAEVVDLKMWESCKIEEKDLLPEGESFEDEHIDESKGDGVESFDQVSVNENVDNGGSSPSKQLSQKKKKPLLRKFGNLLKKKGTSTNQK
ncbi:hypothetical protein CASFOL_007033 [Castilleja foliolosa]|uniref:Uncharacterized protein n=1 Tax=Castilleja foliolosa TaxID=1961234 RepID=A0ABD3E826_9LAMI